MLDVLRKYFFMINNLRSHPRTSYESCQGCGFGKRTEHYRRHADETVQVGHG